MESVTIGCLFKVFALHSLFAFPLWETATVMIKFLLMRVSEVPIVVYTYQVLS